MLVQHVMEVSKVSVVVQSILVDKSCRFLCQSFRGEDFKDTFKGPFSVPKGITNISHPQASSAPS